MKKKLIVRTNLCVAMHKVLMCCGVEPRTRDSPRGRTVLIVADYTEGVTMDALGATVDHKDLCRRVRKFFEVQKFDTLEGAALSLAEFILEEFPLLWSIEVTVPKEYNGEEVNITQYVIRGDE